MNDVRYSRVVARLVLPAVGGPAAVATRRAGHVELAEALVVGPGRLPAPDAPALVVPHRAAAVETETHAVVAGDAVLEEDVRRALRGVAVAHLRQVALVAGAAAYRAGWKELKDEQEHFCNILN